MSNIKREVLFRLNIVFIVLCGVGLFIVGQALRIQVVEGDLWREMGKQSTRIDTIEGERGNIYSEDGRLIATSLPVFEVRMDMTVANDSLFQQNVDSLAWHLANFYRDKSQDEYKQKLINERLAGNRYLLIGKDADYLDLQKIKTFPLLRLGRYKGGRVIISSNKRYMPFGLLAKRTIGYARQSNIGIEGAFDNYLRGSSAPVSKRKVAGGDWVPLFDEALPEVKNGMDVYTTLDINLQDVVENALLLAMKEHNALYGCAVVMEVKTGKIKAIANLGRGDGNYFEKYNFAVGTKNEPGSTFKVATLAALLEDGFVSDSSIVFIEGGRKKYHDKWMKDDSYYPQDSITLTKVMQISSNVGISKLAETYYGANPSRFIQKLRDMHLTEPTNIQIEGEPVPVIKKPGDADWSGISLPWMAIGYEVSITPLQMLTFYNAIANDGVMMMPYLVNEIKDLNTTVHQFAPEALGKRICHANTAQTIRRILKGVIESGTAKNLYSENFSVAGKTGTALIAKDNTGYKQSYQASIAGFFPAENPVYSCIVVINAPTEGSYYGAAVAGPVFKEIIEKYYSTNSATHVAIERPKDKNTNFAKTGGIPLAYNGNRYDLSHIYNTIGISNTNSGESDWAVPQRKSNSVELDELRIKQNLIPQTVGMGLKDALYLLESNGLKVRFSGQGRVVDQVPNAGIRYKKGDTVVLELR